MYSYLSGHKKVIEKILRLNENIRFFMNYFLSKFEFNRQHVLENF